MLAQARRERGRALSRPSRRRARRERWGGLIDVTPDAVPVISAVDALPGFYLATGFSGHGFGIGPGAGKLMADIVTGRSAGGGSGAVPASRRFAGRKRAA